VDVDDASRVGGEEDGSDDAHEPGQNDQVDFLGAENLDELALGLRIEASTRGGGRDAFGACAMAASEIEKTRPGLIGKNSAQFDRQNSRVDGAADRLQVGAAAGAEHTQAESTLSAHFAWLMRRERDFIGR